MKTFGKKLFVVVGPSGAGKGTLCNEAMKRGEHVKFITTCTTRAMREGEQHGVDYFFLTKAEFQTGIEAGDFLEYDPHYDHFYGTRTQEVLKVFESGSHALTDMNWAGIPQLQEKLGHDVVVPVLLLPPSFDILAERLQAREAAGGRKLSAERLEKIEQDFAHIENPMYDFSNPDMVGSRLGDYRKVFVNDDINRVVDEFVHFIESF